jgi:hypothetical protein
VNELIPTHPLHFWEPPSGCHPVIASIPNWREKIVFPWPPAARLRRKMLTRGIKLGIPRPLTEASKSWTYWEHVRNAASSNMATASASTFGLPKYNPATGLHEGGERNEFVNHPQLLKFV